MRCVVLSLALVLVASAVADDLSCPFNSKGKHPKCICNDDKPYDEVNGICATVLDAEYLLAKCPKGSEGTFPACICGDGKVYVPDRDECVFVDRSQCPVGAKLVNNKCVCADVNGFRYEFDEIFWICRPWYIPTTHAPTTPKPCPLHQYRVGDVCEWERCPVGYLSKTGYWPDCTKPPNCQEKGMIGEYPNCHERPIHRTCDAHKTGEYPNCHWLPCPDAYLSKTGFWPDCQAPPSCNDIGLTGVYPDCIKPLPPCPQYHHRNANGECVPVKCPPGHVGDYQPNCKLVPKCPDEYPGIWPNCNIYATTPRNGVSTTKITTTPRASTTTFRTTTTATKTTTPRSTTRITTTSTTTSATTPQPKTTPRSTTRITTTPTTTTTTTTTTPKPTTPKPITTTIRTTPRPQKCFCDCASDEIVIFRDNVVRDPSRKYKRFINQKHFDQN